MPRVLILAEDSAHAALICTLTPQQLEAVALAVGPRADWIVGQVASQLATPRIGRPRRRAGRWAIR